MSCGGSGGCGCEGCGGDDRRGSSPMAPAIRSQARPAIDEFEGIWPARPPAARGFAGRGCSGCGKSAAVGFEARKPTRMTGTGLYARALDEFEGIWPSGPAFTANGRGSHGQEVGSPSALSPMVMMNAQRMATLRPRNPGLATVPGLGNRSLSPQDCSPDGVDVDGLPCAPFPSLGDGTPMPPPNNTPPESTTPAPPRTGPDYVRHWGGRVAGVIAQCGPGQQLSWDRLSCELADCPPGEYVRYELNGKKSGCTPFWDCPPGFERRGAYCFQTPGPPRGSDGATVVCAPGQHIENGACVRNCPLGLNWIQPTAQNPLGDCSPSCGAGQFSDGLGNCITCRSGSVPVTDSDGYTRCISLVKGSVNRHGIKKARTESALRAKCVDQIKIGLAGCRMRAHKEALMCLDRVNDNVSRYCAGTSGPERERCIDWAHSFMLELCRSTARARESECLEDARYEFLDCMGLPSGLQE